MLEILKPHHQPRRFGRAAVVRAIQDTKRIIETLPIDQLGEPIKFVPLIENVLKRGAEEI